MIKKLVVKILETLKLYSLYVLRTNSYLYNEGWFCSFEEKRSVNLNGEPLPWMTYPVIKFLQGRIGKEMTVFEYSCGNSTLWWATRVKKIISCEHDRQWYEKIKKVIPKNVELYQIDLRYEGEYSKKILEFEEHFDIIIIDGRDRINCAKNCLNALKKNGVIVWDNSNRDSYDEGYEYLIENGYKRIDFEGIGPINASSWCTSIFYKEENCLCI